jgi:catechol 2,3-dioxygenase-like lactoylglutathione lyase family enzyme
MLGDNDAIATIAVKNLPAAKRFYQDTLGLKPVDAEGKELIMFQSGQTRVNVYHSEFAGTNRATACTWAVGDRFDEIVKSLKAKGVRFEHYDMPGLKLDGDVHVAGKMKIVWFKDPDGNILNVVNG